MIEKKIILFICSIVIYGIIVIIGFFIGLNIVFNAYDFENEIKVSTVSVVKIENNSVIFSPGIEMNHGEYEINEIKKPLFIPLKEQDLIHVRYHIDNPTDAHYVLNPEIGIIVILCSWAPILLASVPTLFLFIGNFLVSFIENLKHKKENKNK